MNDAHKIAVLGKDVYMLYVLEMVRDSGLLLFLWRYQSPKFAGVADVTCNGAFRWAVEHCGKHCAISD